jgi:hypothetical protein
MSEEDFHTHIADTILSAFPKVYEYRPGGIYEFENRTTKTNIRFVTKPTVS